MSPDADNVDNTALDDILSAMSGEDGPQAQDAEATADAPDSMEETANVEAATAESSTTGAAESSVDNVDNSALDDILSAMSHEDQPKAQDAQTTTDASDSTQEAVSAESPPAESSNTGAAEGSADNVDNSALDDILSGMIEEDGPQAQDAEATESTGADTGNTALDDILAASKEGTVAEADDAGSATTYEPASQDLGDLLLDAEATPPVDPAGEELSGEPDQSMLESILTEVKAVPEEQEPPPVEDEAPAEEEASLPPPPAPAPWPGHAPQLVAAPAPLADRKIILLLGGILAVNGIGILLLAGALLLGQPEENNSFPQLVAVLREDLQERRSAVEEQGTDAVIVEVEKAGQLFDAGQYEEALPLLRRTSAALPSRSDLAWKTAVCLMQLKRWQEAIQAMQSYARRFSDSKVFADALMRIGDCYSSLGLHDHARKAYYRVVGFSGRFTKKQQELVPVAYDKIAASYKSQALALAAARTIKDESEDDNEEK
jgi:tetratricopeptide (TPR) repeat protein